MNTQTSGQDHITNPHVRFLHIRSSDLPILNDKIERGELNPQFGGVTVAFALMRVTDPSGRDMLFLKYGAAVCSLKDRYVKDSGRKLAFTRFGTMHTHPDIFSDIVFIGFGVHSSVSAENRRLRLDLGQIPFSTVGPADPSSCSYDVVLGYPEIPADDVNIPDILVSKVCDKLIDRYTRRRLHSEFFND
jgi:hypothetical protein